MAFKVTEYEEPTVKVPSRIERSLQETYRKVGGPEGELSDEQINRALKHYMGIQGQTAQDYLMDFLEMAPTMMGMPAAITAAGASKLFKPLAKEFRALTKPSKEFVKSFLTEGDYKLAESVIRRETKRLGTQEKTYRGIIKGLRNIPQETLDTLESIGLLTKGRKGVGGKYLPKKRRIEIHPQTDVPIETIGHEIEHSRRITGRLRERLPVTAKEKALLEGTAYEFGDLFAQEVAKLPKGQRLSSEMFDEIYERAHIKAREKWGPDPTIWEKEEIVRGAKKRVRAQKEERALSSMYEFEGGL